MAQPAPQSARIEVVEQHAGPQAPSALEDALGRLAARYTFRRPDEVSDYLRRHPHLVPVLFEATEVVPRYFGADAPLVLEVFTDPEEDAPRPELFALVQTTLGPDEARERMDRLDDDWWTDASPDGPGVLVVDLEFV